MRKGTDRHIDRERDKESARVFTRERMGSERENEREGNKERVFACV